MPSRLINLTPHTVHLLLGDRLVTIPASGRVARCEVTEKRIGVGKVGLQTFPLVKTIYGEIEGLPEPKSGTYFVVSAIVASASGRRDLLVPHRLVRRGGRVTGCRALAQVITNDNE